MGVDIEFSSALDVATLGSAMTVAVAVGIFKDYNDAVKHQKIAKRFVVTK